MRNHKVPDNYEVKDVSVGMKSKKGIFGILLGTFALAFAVSEIIDAYQPFTDDITKTDKGMWCLWLLVGFVIVIMVHELLHYLAFRACGAKPYFTIQKVKGFGWCPAVGVRDSVCSKGEFIITCLMPQVASVIFIMAGLWMSAYIGRLLMYMGLMNLLGGIGDYQILYHVLKAPKCALFGDTGSGVRIYVPALGGEG